MGKTDGIIDKILSHAIQSHVLDPSLLPPLLRAARAALFPNNSNSNNAPATAPSAAEQAAVRAACAEAILGLVPEGVRGVYFGSCSGSWGEDEVQDEKHQEEEEESRRRREVEEGILNVLSDAYCNKHLLYGVVELVVVRLVPEVGARGVRELVGERVG